MHVSQTQLCFFFKYVSVVSRLSFPHDEKKRSSFHRIEHVAEPRMWRQIFSGGIFLFFNTYNTAWKLHQPQKISRQFPALHFLLYLEANLKRRLPTFPLSPSPHNTSCTTALQSFSLYLNDLFPVTQHLLFHTFILVNKGVWSKTQNNSRLAASFLGIENEC